MRFGLIAYPKKPIIIAHSGVSRETRCLKIVWSLLQLAYFARSCIHAGSSEPSPHDDVTRTIISCADQFIVLIFHCGPLFYFLEFLAIRRAISLNETFVLFC